MPDAELVEVVRACAAEGAVSATVDPKAANIATHRTNGAKAGRLIISSSSDT